ncbi:MAG TPA: arylsulfatase [Verrucomicrobiales bacterium]|nr:arylsulfatase [Verrucomicrobiales bacterium]
MIQCLESTLNWLVYFSGIPEKQSMSHCVSNSKMKSQSRIFKSTVLLLVVVFFLVRLAQAQPVHSKPNIIIIYADDLGYADVGCYGATQVKTPNIDRLANEGLMFTDGHAPAATCTPSRFAMLTGQYAWRQKGTGIARGDAALIIDPETMTMPDLMKKSGYQTGVVGKWHLGLGPNGGPNWNGRIKPGPLEVGFNYAFLIPATGDRVPCVYVENHHVVNLDPKDPIQVNFKKRVGSEPIGKEHPELLKMHPSHGHDRTIINGISRIGYMTGGKTAHWKDEDMADDITSKALKFIDRNATKPFFLFFSLHDIHVPRVPHPRFVGKTTMGPRGDAIVQTDWCVGQIMGKLDDLNIAGSTLILFTSDNGPVIDDGYQDDAVEKLGRHNPAGPLRGGKYSAFEAGTRVPWIMRWPGKIKPGKSSALVSQVDLPSSFAHLANVEVPHDAIPDSFNVMDALLGNSKSGRDHLVEQARTLSLRVGDWKWISPAKGARINKNTNTELGNDPKGLLYYLGDDLGEKRELSNAYPERAREMERLLSQIKENKRSRP